MPLDPAGLQTRIVSGLSDLDEAEWALCYPAEAEDWRYYRACEAETVPGVALAAVEVRDQHGLAAAAPLFQLAYRLDTPLQGALRRLSEAVSRRLPSLTEWRMLGRRLPLRRPLSYRRPARPERGRTRSCA